jgi:hypothetical protein
VDTTDSSTTTKPVLSSFPLQKTAGLRIFFVVVVVDLELLDALLSRAYQHPTL